jgi:hypothetical protein
MRERQRGQTTAEYLGVLLLVVAIVLALVATGINSSIAEGVNTAICRIIGLECEVEPPKL